LGDAFIIYDFNKEYELETLTKNWKMKCVELGKSLTLMKDGTRRREVGAGPMVLRMISTFSDSSSATMSAIADYSLRLTPPQQNNSNILFTFNNPYTISIKLFYGQSVQFCYFCGLP
jgi:hypothetical protein